MNNLITVLVLEHRKLHMKAFDLYSDEPQSSDPLLTGQRTHTRHVSNVKASSVIHIPYSVCIYFESQVFVILKESASEIMSAILKIYFLKE